MLRRPNIKCGERRSGQGHSFIADRTQANTHTYTHTVQYVSFIFFFHLQDFSLALLTFSTFNFLPLLNEDIFPDSGNQLLVSPVRYCFFTANEKQKKNHQIAALFLLYLLPSQLTALFSKDTLIVKRRFFVFVCVVCDFIVTTLSSFTSTHIMLCFAYCL